MKDVLTGLSALYGCYVLFVIDYYRLSLGEGG